MEYQYIEYQEQGGVATLTLNRPDVLNALSPDMIVEIMAALDYVADNGTARVLVIQGAGRAFCAGADLAPTGAGDGRNTIHETHYNRLLTKLVELPCPVITAVNGAAVGAGCAIALLSDFVIVSDNSYFMQAFVNIGLVPDMGMTWLLPRLVGAARATEMLMLGEKIPAEKAEQWGLIYKKVSLEELENEARALAARLAKGPTLAYKMIRQGIRYGLEHSLMETIQQERKNQLTAARSNDFHEGTKAFMERRPPSFSGD